MNELQVTIEMPDCMSDEDAKKIATIHFGITRILENQNLTCDWKVLVIENKKE